MTGLLPIVLCVVAVIGLLRAEKTGSRSGIWLTKPVAVVAFLTTALTWGALETAYGRRLLLALLLCGWGDILLIPRERRSWLRAGIVAFLAGHLAYITAFVRLPMDRHGLILGLLLAAGLAGLVVRWLIPRLPGSFRRLVMIYVAVICAMLVVAFAVSEATGRWHIALGASLFAVSDLAVARDRFVARAFVNRAWGLPLYFAAQLILAMSVAG